MQKQIGGTTPGPLKNHELNKGCTILTPNKWFWTLSNVRKAFGMISYMGSQYGKKYEWEIYVKKINEKIFVKY